MMFNAPFLKEHLPTACRSPHSRSRVPKRHVERARSRSMVKSYKPNGMGRLRKATIISTSTVEVKRNGTSAAFMTLCQPMEAIPLGKMSYTFSVSISSTQSVVDLRSHTNRLANRPSYASSRYTTQLISLLTPYSPTNGGGRRSISTRMSWQMQETMIQSCMTSWAKAKRASGLSYLPSKLP